MTNTKLLRYSMSSPACGAHSYLVENLIGQRTGHSSLMSTSDRIDDLNRDYMHELGAGRINLKRPWKG